MLHCAGQHAPDSLVLFGYLAFATCALVQTENREALLKSFFPTSALSHCNFKSARVFGNFLSLTPNILFVTST